MAHILDRLITYYATNQRRDSLLFGHYIDRLSSAEMIMAENVFEFYYSALKPTVVDGEEMYVVDRDMKFPNLAPPFPTFFVGVNSLPRHEVMDRFSMGGCLFCATPILEKQDGAAMACIELLETSRVALHREGCRWVVQVIPWLYDRMFEGWTSPLSIDVLFVYEDGSPGISMKMFDIPSVDRMSTHYGMTRKAYTDELENVFDFVIPPSMFTVCLLHCRNVQTVEHAPPRRQVERAKKQGKRSSITFRTLQIEPMKRVLRTEGGIESKGLNMALHICRGHFKDFRDGPGLFGKHKDIYWWESQMRGNATYGTILKDYRMPSDDASHQS